MAASTIPNSGGPGSSIELSPVTIAVRDKVIEKFADQPLDEMNESVKQLLSKEEDEQKRLGILAARVYILRQRISRIAEGDPDRVVGSAAPKARDLMPAAPDNADADTGSSEWTRLRILDDCEVNGVRFPKTVIIDVKSEDAEKLIASGSAELVEEDPASTVEDAAAAAATEAGEPAAEAAAETAAETADIPAADAEATQQMPADEPEEPAVSEDDLSALSAAMDTAAAPASQEAEEDTPQMPDEPQADTGEAVIDAPSAAEVTAALEALGGGNDSDAEAAAVPAPAATDIAASEDSQDDAADVAAELEALSASLAPEGETTAASEESEMAESDAADVAAELEAAAAAMAAGPSDSDTSNLPPAGDEQTADGEDADGKPAGWFEAQQTAEQSKRDGEKSENDED